MPEEQPQYFTLIDLAFELFHVALISVGCYIGWILTNHFLGLFAGGIVGRIVGVCIVLSIRSVGNRASTE